VEADRQRLLAIERLILETVCFNFTAKLPFPYVIKLGKELKGVLEFLRLSDLNLSVTQHPKNSSSSRGGLPLIGNNAFSLHSTTSFLTQSLVQSSNHSSVTVPSALDRPWKSLHC